MKTIFATISLLLLSQSVFSSDYQEIYQSFEGEYELVETIAETSPNMITRGSRCREALVIEYIYEYDTLHLSSRNIDRPGITLNMLATPSDQNETTLSENSIVQNRYNERKIFGFKKKNNMITSLSREGDFVRLQYTASTETSIKTFIEAESICIYKEL